MVEVAATDAVVVVYLLDVIRVDVVVASSADVVHVMDVIRVDVIFVSYADVLVYLVHFLLLLQFCRGHEGKKMINSIFYFPPILIVKTFSQKTAFRHVA